MDRISNPLLYVFDQVFQTAMPCFSRYGKLATGLQRLKLSSASLETNQNLGLWPLSRRNDREDDTIDYDDPVWEASRVLHTLERFEERGREPGGTIRGAGAVPAGRERALDARPVLDPCE